MIEKIKVGRDNVRTILREMKTHGLVKLTVLIDNMVINRHDAYNVLTEEGIFHSNEEEYFTLNEKWIKNGTFNKTIKKNLDDPYYYEEILVTYSGVIELEKMLLNKYKLDEFEVIDYTDLPF